MTFNGKKCFKYFFFENALYIIEFQKKIFKRKYLKENTLP